MSAPHVSVVIATYKEREGLEALWPTLAPILRQVDAECIVVDDNSPDGTAEFARTLRDPTPTVIVRHGVRGQALATAEGFRAARGVLLATMDGDGQQPPELLPMLVKAVDDGAEIAVGCRRSGSTQADGLVREASSILARAITRPLTPCGDPMNEYYVLRRSVLARASYRPFGARTGLNLLARARPQPIAQVSFTRHKRLAGRSKTNVKKALLDLLLITQLYTSKLAPTFHTKSGNLSKV